MRHGVRGQQRRTARVNMRTQRGFDLARATDAQRHPAARAAPEITTPVQPTIRSAPIGEPTNHNARRTIAELNTARGEPLARHECTGETVEIGRARIHSARPSPSAPPEAAANGGSIRIQPKNERKKK
jgi:hypothetical protein